MDPASEALIETWGPAGAIIVLLSLAIIWLAKTLIASQRSRVEDAQKVTGALIDMTKEWHRVMGELTRAVERLDETVDRQHD